MQLINSKHYYSMLYLKGKRIIIRCKTPALLYTTPFSVTEGEVIWKKNY